MTEFAARATGTTAAQRIQTPATTRTSGPEQLIAPAPVSGAAGQVRPADLMGQWRTATVKAAAEEAALHAPNLPGGQSFVDVLRAALKDLPKEQKPAVRAQAYATHDAYLKQQTTQFQAQFDQDVQGTIDRVLQTGLTAGGYLDRLEDKFETAVVNASPTARDGETVLWEDSEVIVLVDIFPKNDRVRRPKALVIPKTFYMLPTDVPPALLQKLADVAAEVAGVFRSVGGATRNTMYVNAPQRLHVRRLHVHVTTDIPKWGDLGISDAAIPGREQALYRAMQTELQQRLQSMATS